MNCDAARAAAFYDDYGEREWTRFEDGTTSRVSLEVHLEYLRRFIRPGDFVLDAGAGPGRFTIELASLGAEIVALDLSPRQLELNRERVAAAGFEDRVCDRVVGGVTDLSPTGGAVGDLLTRLELELAAEPGALDCAPHVLAVLRKDE